jgi:hypothetical protein
LPRALGEGKAQNGEPEQAVEINDRLTDIIRREEITKAEAMRRAFALLSVAEQEKAKGNSPGIIREDPRSRELQAIGWWWVSDELK